MQDNNEADDKFRELADSMHNFEAEPPAGMWNRIEGGLAKRRRRIMIFRYSSIAASLILLLGLGVTYFTTDIFRSSGNKMISDSELNTNAKSGTDSSKGKINYPPENAKPGTDKNRNIPSIKVDGPSNQQDIPQEESPDKGSTLKDQANKSNLIKSNISVNKVDPLKKLNDSDPLLAENSLNTGNTQTENSLKTANRQTENSLKTGKRTELFLEEPVLEGIELAVIAHINPYPAFPEPEDLDVQPGEYANDWSLAMGYGITSGADFTNNDEILNSGGDRFSHDDFSADLANETSYFEEIDNTVHDAPLSLGVIVDKRLSRRLSFETGITYTLLSFRVKTDELSPYYKKYRNELNYLGLPAGLRYRFIDRKKFNLYTMQWVVLEKGIGGRWYVDTYTNDVITESESKQQNIRGFQLSSVTGLGGEVKLGGKFYLFAQGGVQVFFMNKTQPYNIRSTQIAWPSVQTGLRINLD